jgi:hypothetical protein
MQEKLYISHLSVISLLRKLCLQQDFHFVVSLLFQHCKIKYGHSTFIAFYDWLVLLNHNLGVF